MENLLYVILGVLLSVAGYFLKRRIEKRPLLEELERNQRLLDLNKNMQEQGLSTQDLSALEQSLLGREKRISQNIQDLKDESGSVFAAESDEELTQSELNKRALERYKHAKKKQKQVLRKLIEKTGQAVGVSLLDSEAEWDRYSKAQATALASRYEGGSIYPLIFYSEMEALTNERTARLKEELDDYIRLGN